MELRFTSAVMLRMCSLWSMSATFKMVKPCVGCCMSAARYTSSDEERFRASVCALNMDISVVTGLDTTTDLPGSKMATDFTCGNAVFVVSVIRLGDASITSTTGFHSGGGN